MYAVRVGTLFYRVNLAGDISKLLIISELKNGRMDALFYSEGKCEQLSINEQWLQEMKRFEIWKQLETPCMQSAKE